MNDAAVIALVRSQLYGLLARGFADPPRTLAEWQAAGQGAEELATAVERLPGGAPLAASLRALERAREAVVTQDTLTELRAQGLELLGNLRTRSFPPYETEYTRGGDFRQNQDLADLMGFYQAFGLNLRGSEESRERPDHIAVELEFMHFLCWKEAAARVEDDQQHIDVCRDAERKFLGDHLGRWAELFARGLEKTAPEGFYPALAALLRAVVTQELANLDVKPEPVEVPAPRRAPEPMSCGVEGAPAPLVQIEGGQ
jgi:DMSO reductase family type II enzyme chaperone